MTAAKIVADIIPGYETDSTWFTQWFTLTRMNTDYEHSDVVIMSQI